MSRVIVCGIFLSVSGCNYENNAHPDVINLIGSIDDRKLKQVRDIIEGPSGSSIRLIEVTSGGGDTRSAIEIGKIVNDNKLEIRVKDYCNSACAQYIFLSGHKRTVLRNSVVFFHKNMEMAFKLHFESRNESAAEAFDEILQKERYFFQKSGIDQGLLTKLSFVGLQPVCVFRKQSMSPTDPESYGYGSNFSAFATSRDIAEKLAGGKIEGYWPESETEMREKLRNLPFSRDFMVGWVGSLNEASPKMSFARPKCPEALLTQPQINP